VRSSKYHKIYKATLKIFENAAGGFTSKCRFLWVAWFDFEQGLGSPERAWFAASQITRQERGAGAKRSPDTPGQDERPCEKQTKTGPTKSN
jgi:hypothetical protein